MAAEHPAAKKPRVVTTVTGVPRELVERRRSSSWVRGSFWFACTWFALGFLFAELVLR